MTAVVLGLVGTGLTTHSASAASDRVSDRAVDNSIRRLTAENGTGKSPSGVGTPRIVGGSETTISKAPYLVQLFYLDGSDQLWFCNGALIAPNKVLTAAQCVYGRNFTNRDRAVILAGSTYRGDLDGSTEIGVKRQWVQPSYRPSGVVHDLAVLTLNGTLPYTTIKLAAASDSALYAAGTKATIQGWGVTGTARGGSGESDVLKTATLPMQADSTCDSALKTALGGQDAFVESAMTCAGEPATDDDTSTTTPCVSDAGAPLVVSGRVVGVFAWGVTNTEKWCGVKGTYPVFTQTSAYAGMTQAQTFDTDASGDGRADLFARKSSGGAASTYNGSTLTTHSSAGTGWAGYNKVLQSDLNRDGVLDYVVRTTAGTLFWRHKVSGQWVNTRVATGWQGVRQILAPGDVNGDGLPDLVAVDSGGTLWRYPGNGKGGFGSRAGLGTGWNAYAQVVAHGDLTGDGRPDLVGRTSAGALYIHPSSTTGTYTFGGRKLVSTTVFKAATALAAVGDVNGDGRADLVTRTGSGTLWLYKGNGNGTFAAPAKGATGLNSFNLFG
ncbi:trypsin-like serine protease [Streptomyces sp. ME02-8801-2C]|uniref:FG-GAP-like repeat-containing protein n=1 Tax=Streptomyces sp. ME02-8801-2C TaxID=3028680 RepID=UPI0029A66F3D|nr:FG-GAP-like repeat-containing protein [Streptomyces sp. ME02-8801-2C]MDX3457954.1 trypsin-like serine protease [Streptomyces sp. ME02-8801-2C]